MDDKLRELPEKARQTCRRAAASAADTAYLAAHQALRVMDGAKLRLRLKELESRRDRELCQVGRLVYATHTGEPTGSQQLLEQLLAVDDVSRQIGEVQAELVRRDGGQVCRRCGAAAVGSDRFCRRCGAKL